MSARGMWIEGRHVFLDDAHGWPTHIPADRIPALLDAAKNNDNGRATFAFRPFDRDLLQGAADLINQADACTADACDNAAPFDLADARPKCITHKEA